jgi:segregation and condensation protein B
MIEKARDLPPAEDSESGGGESASEEGLATVRARGGLPLGEADALAAVDAAADELEGLHGDAGAGVDAADAADDSEAEGAERSGAPGAAAEARRAERQRLPLVQRVEALLFASAQALTPQRLANVLEVPVEAVHAALAEAVAGWKQRPGAVELVEIAGGFRFMTRAEYHADIAGLRGKVTTERLSPAALETLAVVAYRQPIGRAEVEAVRGVQVGPVLRLLLDRDLIRITGRSTEPGHPLLYGTTKRFLDHFGLKSLKALPDLKDLLESP